MWPSGTSAAGKTLAGPAGGLLFGKAHQVAPEIGVSIGPGLRRDADLAGFEIGSPVRANERTAALVAV